MKNPIPALLLIAWFTAGITPIFGESYSLVPASLTDTTLVAATICEGGVYQWDGVLYDMAGEYTMVYTGSDGLDSVVVLSLTELSNDTTYVAYTICSDQPNPVTGVTLDPNFSDTIFSNEMILLQNQFGCDSIIQAEIKLLPNEFLYVWGIMIPVGSEFQGVFYDASGSYIFNGIPTCCDENGCTVYSGGELYVYSATDEYEQSIKLQVMPNPFAAHFSFGFELPQAVSFSASIHAMTGQISTELAHQERLAAGTHHFDFEQPDLPPGIYLLQLQFAEQTVVKKLVKGE